MKRFWWIILALIGCLPVMSSVLLQAAEKAVLGKSNGKRTVTEVTTELAPGMVELHGKETLAELTDGGPLLLVAIKDEKKLEVWKKTEKARKFAKVMEFPWTATSGGPGPKLQEGDGQIPEGVYGLEYLNPNSKYHLSMKIDYPNAFDRARGKEDKRKRLGGDIMIHGKMVTIGCIPIGDPAIETVFYLVAKNGIKNTKVVMAPTDFRKGKPAPVLDHITWEGKLYTEVAKALEAAKP